MTAPMRGIARAPRSSAMAVIAAMFEARTGQDITPARAARLEVHLTPVLRARNLANVDELASAIVTAHDPRLTEQVVDALLNQETSFFRDAAVYDLVVAAVQAMRAASPRRRLRIWSVGCSAGQEPLSIAIALDECGLRDTDVEIIATDVSAAAVARARAARYSQFEIQRGLSIRRMIAWFEGGGGEDWSARRALVDRIQFRCHNLVTDSPPPGRFDVILCRNVLLYFAPEVRRAAFENLARAMAADGVLALGAGETVIGQTDRFDPARRWRGLYALRPAG